MSRPLTDYRYYIPLKVFNKLLDIVWRNYYHLLRNVFANLTALQCRHNVSYRWLGFEIICRIRLCGISWRALYMLHCHKKKTTYFSVLIAFWCRNNDNYTWKKFEIIRRIWLYGIFWRELSKYFIITKRPTQFCLIFLLLQSFLRE